MSKFTSGQEALTALKQGTKQGWIRRAHWDGIRQFLNASLQTDYAAMAKEESKGDKKLKEAIMEFATDNVYVVKARVTKLQKISERTPAQKAALKFYKDKWLPIHDELYALQGQYDVPASEKPEPKAKTEKATPAPKASEKTKAAPASKASKNGKPEAKEKETVKDAAPAAPKKKKLLKKKK